MILTIDTAALDADDSESYAGWRGDFIEAQLNGKTLKDCMYCNVEKGLAICMKRNLLGHVVIIGDDIVYEMRVGTVTVKPITDQRPSPPGKE